MSSERADAVVVGVDISADALALARENAARLGLEVEFVETSLLAGQTGPFDLVVSNPPYVGEAEVPSLPPEVRDFEPRVAVVGALAAELAAAARAVLVPGGALVLESHSEHAREVAAAVAELGYREATIVRDLTGAERVVEARWRPET